MPEWKKGEQPKLGEATNSQRMFKVLKVLKKYSDSNNRLTQEQILKLLAGDKDIDYSCNIKTLRQTLTDLIAMANPDVLTDKNRDEFVIRYKGWEKGIPERLSQIYYKPLVEVSEMEGIFDGIALTDTLSLEQKKRLIEKLRMEYPRLTAGKGEVSLFSVDDSEAALQNTKTILDAAARGRQIAFHFGGYDREGNIVPRKGKNGRARIYREAPYFVVIYGGRRYMLCSHIHSDGRQSDSVSIYRVDLMSDIVVTDKPSLMINDIREFRNTNAHEFMQKHPNMMYGDPITVTLAVDVNYYTLLHDHFGGSIEFVRSIDGEHDEVKVTSSEKGILDLAMTAPDRIEILRPFKLREKLAEQARIIVEKYGGITFEKTKTEQLKLIEKVKKKIITAFAKHEDLTLPDNKTCGFGRNLSRCDMSLYRWLPVKTKDGKVFWITLFYNYGDPSTGNFHTDFGHIGFCKPKKVDDEKWYHNSGIDVESWHSPTEFGDFSPINKKWLTVDDILCDSFDMKTLTEAFIKYTKQEAE
ncbi:MAG: WYL domain-containing protein [Ruminococcus sp.]|nr:WYL domain-containing protein [Ruminococcus sp.]